MHTAIESRASEVRMRGVLAGLLPSALGDAMGQERQERSFTVSGRLYRRAYGPLPTSRISVLLP